MKHKVDYEWDIETVDEDGDIIDHNFSDRLSFGEIDGDLVLVRSEWSDNNGLEERYWAYVKDGRLPERFSDSRAAEINIKVPQRFHNELKAYFK